MDQNIDMRNELLAEIIDKMHDRLAEKHYPTEKPKEEEVIAAVTEDSETPKDQPEAEEELSDEDLDALMPQDTPAPQA